MKPLTIQSGLGSATYAGNSRTGSDSYRFATPQDAQNQAATNQSRDVMTGLGQQVLDPMQAIQHQQDIYRNAMVPAFDKQMHEQMGGVVAGLGNQYSGTYGQLTANQEALNEGIARAGLEKSIYDSGQSMYDQMLNRYKTGGDVYNQATTTQNLPYQGLGNLLNIGNAGVTGYNTARNQQYQTKVGGSQQSVAGVQPSFMQQLAPVASAALSGGSAGG